MLTKEPKMLQPDAFCEHTMQQNATAAGALGELTALPQTPSLVLRGRFAAGKERGREGREREESGRERERRGREGGEGEVDSDAQLVEGR